MGSCGDYYGAMGMQVGVDSGWGLVLAQVAERFRAQSRLGIYQILLYLVESNPGFINGWEEAFGDLSAHDNTSTVRVELQQAESVFFRSVTEPMTAYLQGFIGRVSELLERFQDSQELKHLGELYTYIQLEADEFQKQRDTIFQGAWDNTYTQFPNVFNGSGSAALAVMELLSTHLRATSGGENLIPGIVKTFPKYIVQELVRQETELFTFFMNSIWHDTKNIVSSLLFKIATLKLLVGDPAQSEKMKQEVLKVVRLVALLQNMHMEMIRTWSVVGWSDKDNGIDTQRPLKFRILFEQVNLLLEDSLRHKRLTLEVKSHFNNQSVKLLAPYIDIQSAVINLVSNAVSHGAAGGEVVVDVELQSIANQSPLLNLVVSVTNATEVPVTEERLRSIFSGEGVAGEIPKTHRGVSGIGLGLPLARLLVEKNGGRIGVTQTIDEFGVNKVTLWFSIPVLQTGTLS